MEVPATGALPDFSKKGTTMNLPQIDISALPDLDAMTGVFGSLAHPGSHFALDELVVDTLVIIYEIIIQQVGGG